MLTPFLLHRCYTEQSVNCFKIGCFSLEERLGVHMKITQAAHNRWKTLGDDQVDQQSYNANRFSVGDVHFLSAEMQRMLAEGAHVIFCWGERVDALVPKHGSWKRIGRDYVWISEGLALRIDAAGSSSTAPALGGS